MKFFTRARYDANQDDSDAAEQDWEQACRAYSEHVARIRDHLAASARSLLGLTLHDGIIENVSRPSPEALELIVDATRNPWGPRGKYCLTFSGVNPSSLREPSLRDWWLYEEVHLSTFGFELRVLFDRSELFVEASTVAIEELEQTAV